MLKKTECLAMLLAGGQGSRLGILTKNIAKPAVPYGGKYRIIDFPLSNCINSGIETVGVLTQYQPLELNDYIGNGQPWDLCKGFDNSAAISEFYPLADFGTIDNLHFRLDINGQTVQEGYTGDMIFKPDYLIAYLSQYYTLKIGDLLFTGTPQGIGQVKPGDRLQAYLEDKLLMDFEIK